MVEQDLWPSSVGIKKSQKKGVNYNHKKPLLDCPIGRSFKKKIKDLSFEPFLTFPADF